MIGWAIKHNGALVIDMIRRTRKEAVRDAADYHPDEVTWEELRSEGWSVVKVEVVEVGANANTGTNAQQEDARS